MELKPSSRAGYLDDFGPRVSAALLERGIFLRPLGNGPTTGASPSRSVSQSHGSHHREWEYLEALRSWQEHRESSDRDTTWSEWFFQLVLLLPVEFNVSPRRFPFITLTIILVCLCIQILGGVAEFADYGVRTVDLDSYRWMANQIDIHPHTGSLN